MKKIPLSQRGKNRDKYFALVDDIDYKWLKQLTWSVCKTRRKNVFYAIYTRKGKKTIYMHRQIMNPPVGMEVDHTNGNGLDNRRCNLRICTRNQNIWNMRISNNNTSGYKGVRWDKRNKKWIAIIKIKYKRHQLGLFEKIKDAARAYNKAAKKYFGEFACFNKI